MFGLIRLLITTILLAGMVWCGATVKLGRRTTFGHIGAIWGSPEGQDMREGVAGKAKEVKRDVRELLAEPAPAAPRAGAPDGGAAPLPRP